MNASYVCVKTHQFANCQQCRFIELLKMYIVFKAKKSTNPKDSSPSAILRSAVPCAGKPVNLAPEAAGSSWLLIGQFFPPQPSYWLLLGGGWLEACVQRV